MLFGFNWPSGLADEDKMLKMTMWTTTATDDRHQMMGMLT
jgi:hypothetical protein